MKGTDSKKMTFALLAVAVMLSAATVPFFGAMDDGEDSPLLVSPDPTDIMVLGPKAGGAALLPLTTGSIEKGTSVILDVLKPKVIDFPGKILKVVEPMKRIFIRVPVVVGDEVPDTPELLYSGSVSGEEQFLQPLQVSSGDQMSLKDIDIDLILNAIMSMLLQFGTPSTYDVDSVKVLGARDKVVLGNGNEFNFGPEGKYVFGPGSTLVLNGEFSITGSGTVMEIQPGAVIEFMGDTFVLQGLETPLEISVKGTFSSLMDFSLDLEKDYGATLSVGFDISEGGIFSVGGIDVYGGAGKELDVRVDLQADLSSLTQYDPEGEDDFINLFAGIKALVTASVDIPIIKMGDAAEITDAKLSANIIVKFPSDWTDPDQNVIEGDLAFNAFIDFGKEPKAITMDANIVFDGPGFKKMVDGEAILPTFSGSAYFIGPTFVESEGMDVASSQAEISVTFGNEINDDGTQTLKVDGSLSIKADASFDIDGVVGYIKVRGASDTFGLRALLKPSDFESEGFSDILSCIELQSISSEGTISIDEEATYDGTTVSFKADSAKAVISVTETEGIFEVGVSVSCKQISLKLVEGGEAYSLTIDNGDIGVVVTFDFGVGFDAGIFARVTDLSDSLVIMIRGDCSFKTPTQSYEAKGLTATIAADEDDAGALEIGGIITISEIRISVNDAKSADPSHITKVDLVAKDFGIGLSTMSDDMDSEYLPEFLSYGKIQSISAIGSVEGKPFSIDGSGLLLSKMGCAIESLDMVIPEEIKGNYSKVTMRGVTQTFKDRTISYELCEIMVREAGSVDSVIIFENVKMVAEEYADCRFLDGTITMENFYAPYFGVIIDGATLNVGSAALGELTLISGNVNIDSVVMVSVFNYIPTVDLTAKGDVIITPEYEYRIQYANGYFEIPWELEISVLFDLDELKFYGIPAPGYIFTEYVYDPLYPDGMEYELLPTGLVLFDHDSGSVMDVQYDLATYMLKIGDEEPIEVGYCDYVELPEPDLRIGVSFVGWSDGTAVWSDYMFMPANDVELTPIFALNYNGPVSESMDIGQDSIWFSEEQVDSLRDLGNDVAIGFDKMTLVISQDVLGGVDGPMSMHVSVEEIEEGTFPNMGKALIYSVNLTDVYGSIHYLYGDAQILMPVPAGWNAEQIAVMHMNSDTAEFEAVNFEIQEIDGKKCVVASTDHFSEFFLQQADIGYVVIPSGGLDLGLIVGIIVVVLVIVVLAAVVIKKKKA